MINKFCLSLIWFIQMICDLQKYKFKWRYDRPSANFKLSKSKLTPPLPPKNCRTSTGFKPMASVLLLQCSNQLSYKDLYIESRPICWVHLNRWKEWNLTWRWCELQKFKFKWRYDHRSGNNNFRNCKLTPKKSYDYWLNWTCLIK